MIVGYSALYEVVFCSSRFQFFEIEFFYSVNRSRRAAMTPSGRPSNVL